MFSDRHGMMGIVDYATKEDLKYALRKLDDTEFRNPFEKCYIRVKEDTRGGEGSRGRDRSRDRSRSRSRSRRRGPLGAGLDGGVLAKRMHGTQTPWEPPSRTRHICHHCIS